VVAPHYLTSPTVTTVTRHLPLLAVLTYRYWLLLIRTARPPGGSRLVLDARGLPRHDPPLPAVGDDQRPRRRGAINDNPSPLTPKPQPYTLSRFRQWVVISDRVAEVRVTTTPHPSPLNPKPEPCSLTPTP